MPSGDKKQKTDENFPDLSSHNNWMAKCLTPAIFHKIKDRKTPNDFTLDKCIQTGEIFETTFYL